MRQDEFNIGILRATADMTGKANRFVKPGAEGYFALAGAGEAILGVLYDEPIANEPGNVMVVGIAEVAAGGTFAAYANIKPDSLGRAVSASGTDNFVAGIALEAATAVGDIVSVLLLGGNLARDLNKTVVVRRTVPAYATAAEAITPIERVEFDATIFSVTYVPNSTLTGADTNSRTLSLINKGLTGAGNTSIASKAFTNTNNAPAYDETALTLSGTPANLDVNEGEILAWNSDAIGTGLADPGGLAIITYKRRS